MSLPPGSVRCVSTGVSAGVFDRGTMAPAAVRPLLVVAGAVAAVLVATSARYGYHRDELYFVVAGRHLDWGYPDQPPLTPLIAGLMDRIAPGVALGRRHGWRRYRWGAIVGS